jgi:hypothetical protein
MDAVPPAAVFPQGSAVTAMPSVARHCTSTLPGGAPALAPPSPTRLRYDIPPCAGAAPRRAAPGRLVTPRWLLAIAGTGVDQPHSRERDRVRRYVMGNPRLQARQAGAEWSASYEAAPPRMLSLDRSLALACRSERVHCRDATHRGRHSSRCLTPGGEL